MNQSRVQLKKLEKICAEVEALDELYSKKTDLELMKTTKVAANTITLSIGIRQINPATIHCHIGNFALPTKVQLPVPYLHFSSFSLKKIK